MKANLITVLFLNLFIFKAHAQLVFFENFTAPFTPSVNGWAQQNNSVPIGSIGWFQANSSGFNAYSGGMNDYYACNYNSQGSSPGGISNFLITPTLNLVNGAIFKFYTRSSTAGSPVFADRMQVLMSQGSGTGSIGTGTTAVGTFTNLLLDINPNLSSFGYPGFWSGYETIVTGVTGTVVGRFAFRYFVEDSGPLGTNGDLIGIDSVTYSMPCVQLFITPSASVICSGQSVNLNVIVNGTNTPTSYSWSSGQTTSSVVVSPSVTSSFTVYGQNGAGCKASESILLHVIQGPSLSVSPVLSNVCANTNVTLTAAGADAYTWSGINTFTGNPFIFNTGSTPGPLQITLTGSSQLTGCQSNQLINLSVNPAPSISISVSNSYVCTLTEPVITASGANSFVWSGAANSSSPTFTYSSGPLPGTVSFIIKGTGSNGCTTVEAYNLNVYACTGIREIESENETFVFPNPFRDNLNFNQTLGDVELFDCLGERVLILRKDESNKLNTSQLPKGIYMLRFNNSNGEIIKSTKIIKE